MRAALEFFAPDGRRAEGTRGVVAEYYLRGSSASSGLLFPYKWKSCGEEILVLTPKATFKIIPWDQREARDYSLYWPYASTEVWPMVGDQIIVRCF
jgi:hypothetical protein